MNIKKLDVYLFYGQKGSGKSLYMASLAKKLFRSYKRQEKNYPQLQKRFLYSNIKFSEKFEKEIGDNLRYWSHPEEIYRVRNADIFWDEIGKDLPAGSWADTPKEIKQIFSHLRKRGNRMFANTQVYEDVDISVRRQTGHAYEITKWFGSRDISASLPPPKNIWGLIILREFDPLQIEYVRDPEQREELVKSWFPHPVLLTRSLVEVYDTTAELPAYQPDKFKEVCLVCREDPCKDPMKDGSPFTKIKHVPV